MPKFTVRDPHTGQSVTLTGDSAPTEAELTDIFAKIPSKTPGLVRAGNVDLFAQPQVKNADGTTSTVDSSSYNIDGKEVLLPSVTPDGRHMKTPDEIIGEYKKTGRHLGMFDTPENATAYATQLHNDYAAGKYAPKTPERTWTDTAVDALPMVGGMVGGAVGGLGGGLPTFGLGAGPGAVVGATTFGAAGEAARQTINRLRGREAPTSSLEAAKQIGTEGAIQGALEGTGQAITAVVTPAAKAVYRGYIKPSLSKVNIAKASQIIDTAFRENLPVTHGAVQEAGKRITELKAKVDSLLAQTTGDVNLSEVANRVRLWAHGMFNRAGRSPEDLEAALKVADRIDRHPSLAYTKEVPITRTVDTGLVDSAGQPITRDVADTESVQAFRQNADLSKANQVKRDLQEGVGPTQYGIQSRAAKTTEKVGARELRLNIEGQAPAVGPLNARESKLIDLARSLNQATGREANRNALFGVPTLLSGMVGGAEYERTHDPLMATTKALAMRVGLHPAVATRAALLAARIAQKSGTGTAVADIARAAVQAVFEDRLKPENDAGSRP